MTPKIYLASDHHIRNDQVSPGALWVLKRLHEADYLAYLVGGSVRDLLMHRRPKDFDISTSAKPEEVKKLFGRQCILIGKRFRLAQVRHGEEIIEVATFRAGETDASLITRDNVFGTPEEDAHRRDFTINGLFYDPLDHKIIDYFGGFEDLQKGLLRVIGEPTMRFQQDPVRMIRLLKFRARFGLSVEKKAAEALREHRFEIKKSSPARILEEMLRMLESSAAAPFFALLYESGFLEILLPTLEPYFEGASGEKIVAYLKAADAMNERGHYRLLDRSVLVSTLLFPIFEGLIQGEVIERAARGEPPPNFGEIIDRATLFTQTHLEGGFLQFPRQIKHLVRYVLETQYRLTPLEKRKRGRERIARQRDFIYPLTFLKMRALIHPELFKSYEYWKRVRKGGEVREDAAAPS